LPESKQSDSVSIGEVQNRVGRITVLHRGPFVSQTFVE